MKMSETKSMHLTRKERDLLAFLRQNAGRCLSRDILLRQVWGYREGVKSRTVDLHVQRLRKKLGQEESAHILTVSRVGYLWTNSPNSDLGITEQPPVLMPDLSQNAN
jgi:two-component system alkaline phosphatase synthesis response regulator PhoP